MNRKVKRMLLGIGIAVIVVLAAFKVMAMVSNRMDTVAGGQGPLLGCPSSPNCVSTQAEDAAHRVEPLVVEDSTENILERIRRMVEDDPNAMLVRRDAFYLHATWRTPLFGFVDDVEFYLDEAEGRLQIRSASRMGHSDFGANRKRVERIRQMLQVIP